MAKILKEAQITTRNARSKLPQGIHWKGIDPDVHIGYRKGKRGGGVWLVRWRSGIGYRQKPLGTADDEIAEGTLDFNAAVRAAKKRVEEARAEARAAAEGPVLTIRFVVEAYIAERDARASKRKGRQVRSDAGQRLRRYVLGQDKRGKQKAAPATPLAAVLVYKLKERDLLRWQASLPDSLKATSKQRLVNDLKAALNSAYLAYRDRLPPELPAIIKYGLKPAIQHDDEAAPLARNNQILSDAQIGRLIRAAREIDAEQVWDGDLYRLVVVLAATGARFSQIARMKVSDVQRDQGRLMVPASRKGRGIKSGSTPVPVGKDVLDALLPVMTGRTDDAPLLERWRWKQVSGGIRWERAGRGPWDSAGEIMRPWHDIRARAEIPGVIPYALRHSSIVRGIRANLPIRLVAALHDTSVAMIERHYGRWIADGLDELAARAVVPLVPPDDDGNVLPMLERA
ncbi:tyrosine-type recombinase/integrase [Sinorhizobium fredii]|uniref:tyrosine-type recombinase/integrase n=1 Tax=Rhizobium fredii TaxID=380 RepID=UPI0005956585|nr:tyrosine-type recombinase/integrase [Sinorhizobium fredii]WOS64256.1 tyrosine-type recombinase/integrase [Sinorhizobium fredii GR64]